MMKSYRIGNILGFEIRVHVSWILIFALVLQTFATEVLPHDLPRLGPGARLLVAGITALLFFASLLAHEISHSIVARRNGIVVEGITLFVFGGVAQLRNEPRSAGAEFRIAIVGPLASFALAALFFLSVIALDAMNAPTVPAVICVYLAYLNAVLAVFNLLPAFPMDGGRVVRAAIWRFTGSGVKATRIAARTGEAFALMLVAYGAWRFLHAELVGGLWTSLIGGFVLANARRTRLMAELPTPERSIPMFVIPNEHLPEGFGDRIAEPPLEPAVPRPAATVVLMRDGRAGPELLLLRRHRAAGFVPGAWVFPGGRVDAADADLELLRLASGLEARQPEAAYWIASAREAFEETGVLLARDSAGALVPDAGRSRELAEAREALMSDAATLRDVLERNRLVLDLTEVVYCAHWITPVAEPRRYDTRFFIARLPEGRETVPDPREMTDAVWLTPDEALHRFREGRLPMVFPTIRTIESLRGFRNVGDVLDAFRHTEITPILPRLVRTAEGVGIVVEGEA